MFNENLINLMRKKNITIKELAYMTGIKASALASYIDSRHVTPNVENALKIAEALDTTVEALTYGTGRKKCKDCEYDYIVKQMRRLSEKNFNLIKSLVDTLPKEND